MTYVVMENCILCKHTSCVTVCPVDAFYEGPNFLVINPDECIDCGICEPECPVSAIASEEAVPAEHMNFVTLNRELSGRWPNINQAKGALPEAERWAKVEGKLMHLAMDAQVVEPEAR